MERNSKMKEGVTRKPWELWPPEFPIAIMG